MIPGTAYLALSDMAIQDDGGDGSVGNGNGVIEAGEIVALWPTFLETGGSGASGLTGTISSAHAGVNILSSAVALGSVGASGETSSASPLLVEFAADLGDGTDVPFLLTVTDSGANSYFSDWSSLVRAPEVEVTSVDWDDVTYGNGNSIIETGERIAISVRLKNYGAGRADEREAFARLHAQPNAVEHRAVHGTEGDAHIIKLKVAAHALGGQ